MEAPNKNLSRMIAHSARPALLVGERRAGNEGMTVLSKIKKPCLNAVARGRFRSKLTLQTCIHASQSERASPKL